LEDIIMLHETITIVTSNHFALTHPAVHVALTPVIGAVAGKNPFGDLAAAMLALFDTVKAPLAGLAFIIAGAAQAVHSPRASGMWISAVLASALLFGGTGVADYIAANTH